MAILDPKNVSIGLLIGLIIGGSVGYQTPQSKIKDLTSEILTLESSQSEIENILTIKGEQLEQAEDSFETQKQEIVDMKSQISEINEERAHIIWMDFRNSSIGCQIVHKPAC
jgi:hypothetical protein